MNDIFIPFHSLFSPFIHAHSLHCMIDRWYMRRHSQIQQLVTNWYHILKKLQCTYVSSQFHYQAPICFYPMISTECQFHSVCLPLHLVQFKFKLKFKFKFKFKFKCKFKFKFKCKCKFKFSLVARKPRLDGIADARNRVVAAQRMVVVHLNQWNCRNLLMCTYGKQQQMNLR